MSEDKMDIGRRDALKGLAVIAGTVAAQPLVQITGLADHAHVHGGGADKAPASNAPYTPVFFNERQYKTVDVVSDLIIPTTDTPGASAAGVAAYIDFMVKEDPTIQKAYRDGLDWLDKKSNTMYGADFTNITPEKQTALLTLISKPKDKSKDENAPGKDFFRMVKNMTIDGYYTSKIGIHQELQYKGNDYLTEFPGCTHPEHKS